MQIGIFNQTGKQFTHIGQYQLQSASISPKLVRGEVLQIVQKSFKSVNNLIKEANVRANAAVVPGYADVRASAVMTDDNNDDVDDGNFDDTLSEILGTSSRVATSTDLDLAFGAVDVNVDLACTSLLSPISHLLSSFFCCCWGAHLRSRSFHYHNHLFPLLVVVL